MMNDNRSGACWWMCRSCGSLWCGIVGESCPDCHSVAASHWNGSTPRAPEEALQSSFIPEVLDRMGFHELAEAGRQHQRAAEPPPAELPAAELPPVNPELDVRCFGCSTVYNLGQHTDCPACGNAAAWSIIRPGAVVEILQERAATAATQAGCKCGFCYLCFPETSTGDPILPEERAERTIPAEPPPAEPPPAEPPHPPVVEALIKALGDRVHELVLWRNTNSDRPYTIVGCWNGQGHYWVRLYAPGLELYCDRVHIFGQRAGQPVLLETASICQMGLISTQDVLWCLMVIAELWSTHGQDLLPGDGRARVSVLLEQGTREEAFDGWYVEGVRFSYGQAQVTFDTSDTWHKPYEPRISLNGSRPTGDDWCVSEAAAWSEHITVLTQDARVQQLVKRVQQGWCPLRYTHPYSYTKPAEPLSDPDMYPLPF